MQEKIATFFCRKKGGAKSATARNASSARPAARHFLLPRLQSKMSRKRCGAPSSPPCARTIPPVMMHVSPSPVGVGREGEGVGG